MFRISRSVYVVFCFQQKKKKKGENFSQIAGQNKLLKRRNENSDFRYPDVAKNHAQRQEVTDWANHLDILLSLPLK